MLAKDKVNSGRKCIGVFVVSATCRSSVSHHDRSQHTCSKLENEKYLYISYDLLPMWSLHPKGYMPSTYIHKLKAYLIVKTDKNKLSVATFHDTN